MSNGYCNISPLAITPLSVTSAGVTVLLSQPEVLSQVLPSAYGALASSKAAFGCNAALSLSNAALLKEGGTMTGALALQTAPLVVTCESNDVGGSGDGQAGALVLRMTACNGSNAALVAGVAMNGRAPFVGDGGWGTSLGLRLRTSNQDRLVIGADGVVTAWGDLLAPHGSLAAGVNLAVGSNVSVGSNVTVAGALGVGVPAPSNNSGVSILALNDIVAMSDARLKRDLRPIEDALSRVSALTGYTFARAPPAVHGARFAGLIAQEVQGVLPEVVHRSMDGTLSVAYGNMVALLVQSIKELRGQVTDLRADVQALRASLG